ncbi:MAG: SMP-30/gluconolactonase/LRE family protein, partial [Desulfobacteraceae bacterium]|nr:SMP-30/gluconolactonase/LRE family protein [Desulfobacteraceae bacterium]
TLSDKQLFASVGADGMTIDSTGNVYLCEDSVLVFDQSGNQIETITLPETPTNVSFGGLSNHTLYITTKTSLYSLDMNVAGSDLQYSGSEDQEEDDDQIDSSNDDSSSCFIHTFINPRYIGRLAASKSQKLDICVKGKNRFPKQALKY